MKQDYQIYCDYKKAINKANQIENYAKKILSVSQEELGSEMKSLSAVWKGEGMNIFQRKYLETNSQVTETYRDLIKIAKLIREVAEKNYRAEMRALEIARKREY